MEVEIVMNILGTAGILIIAETIVSWIFRYRKYILNKPKNKEVKIYGEEEK